MVAAHVADHSAADELHAAVQMLLAQRRRAIATFGFSILVEVIGILQLWCSMRAVGWHPGLAAPVVAYSVSVLFSIVGFVPGGLGVVEASLGALLVSMSMRSADAVAAVVLYRLVELWLPFVVGAVAAHRLRRGVR
jgi:uncharacterized protein (TIRG00374 family)